MAVSTVGRFMWAFNLGAVIRESTDDFAYQQGSTLTFSTGASLAVIPNDSFVLIDLYGSTPFAEFFEHPEGSPLELLVGYKHRVKRYFVTVGGGLGITSGRGVPEWRALLNIGYVTKPNGAKSTQTRQVTQP